MAVPGLPPAQAKLMQLQTPQSGNPARMQASPAVYRPNNALPVFPGPVTPGALNSIQRQIPGRMVARSASSSRPRSSSVIQGLIVLDQDVDVSRLMAAVDIYNKWAKKGKPERITSMKLADLSALKQGEKLYLVAHGGMTNDESERTHGDRTAKQLAELLLDKGLPSGNVVKLISCNSGDGDGKSFAANLGNLLDRKNSVVGIRGLETTENGHTRASSELPKEAMDEYYKIQEEDQGFVKAEELVAKFKIYLTKEMDEVKVQNMALKVAALVNKLGEETAKKLDEFFKKYVTVSSKSEAEYIHHAVNGRPMGPSAFPASAFNPDYPGLEFSF